MDNVKEKYPDVYEYVLKEEIDFQTRRIPIATNWEWSMYEHVDRSFQLKNSQFFKGANDYTRPFHNVILPIASVNYRTEGFDVKDVMVYVDDNENYYKSLLVRKFHSKWAKKYSIDTAIDESVESYFDYGLTLVKNVNEKRPEIVPLQMLAFCDQTDILSGPICIKHQYSIDQLNDMKGTWDSQMIDKTILMARFAQTRDRKELKTPSKYVEVYELHGTFPDSWLTDSYEDNGTYSPQIHIITYYVDIAENTRNGICLFKGKEPKPIFKALKRDPIFGRACGRGGIEELFHPQIWANSSKIHLQQQLEATSKVILQTSDKKLSKNNKLANMKHGQIMTHEPNAPLTQLVLQPINKPAFDANIISWEQLARSIGSASDPQLGLAPTSGTPLGTTQIVTNQGEGIHDYRRGKIAVFWGEIYRDWVLPQLAAEINNGDKWLDELTASELQEVSEQVAVNETNKQVKNMILSGKVVTQQDYAGIKQMIQQNFAQGGSKRFIEIMKNEIGNLPLDVDFSIAGKQKNLADVVQKLNGIFTALFANPSILKQPGMGDLFNEILENSGLSPINFASLTEEPRLTSESDEQSQPQMQPPQSQQPQVSPISQNSGIINQPT